MQTSFLLQNKNQYEVWRKQKFSNTPDFKSIDSNNLFIDIKNPNQITDIEKSTILEQCLKNSMCLYRISNKSTDTKADVHNLANQLGMRQLDNNICADNDSLTSITKTPHVGQHEYIPYSSKRLSWHTDGYYNTPNKQINSMLLHCSTPAKEGGESLIMDHELAYILLRDMDPAYIEGLMQADAMTIPANILNGEIIRKAQTGPVFSINKKGQLHMRYSARKRNIEWKQSTPILEAVEFLDELLNSDSPFIIKYTLQAGEGLICRNVLHRRTSFVDYDDSEKKRLLYRGRYYDCLPTPA